MGESQASSATLEQIVKHTFSLSAATLVSLIMGEYFSRSFSSRISARRRSLRTASRLE